MIAAIHYDIKPADLSRHLFDVTLSIEEPDHLGQQLWLPAWIPGSYLIRDFAKHLQWIEASDEDDTPIAVQKLGKARWQLAPCEGPVKVRYQVYAWDLSVRGSHLDETHGFFNGTSVFLAVAGQENEPVTLDIQPPVEAPHWQLATGLTRQSSAPWHFGRFSAQDYDALIDHPVEMGDFEVLSFEACGIPHHLVLTGHHYGDKERLKRDLAAICETQLQFFGAPYPFDEYWFLTMVTSDGYGGLEHRNSTALMIPRYLLNGKDYNDFLALCSHEYFHNWNVKRIKPQAFLPYQLERESHSIQLWAYEGITSYYDDLMLHRAGLIDAAEYLDRLATTLTRVARGPGRLVQSLADSSFDAWTKFYQQDENAPNAIVSYYTKGAIMALCLDLTLRLRSEHSLSLDDVMERLWEDFGRQCLGTDDTSHQRIAESLLGESLESFFNQALHGTEDLPVQKLLAALGVSLRFKPASDDNDTGGNPGKARSERLTLGAKLADADGGIKLLSVTHGSAADQAGLAAGDVIVAIDGLRARLGKLQTQLTAIGERPVEVHAFRRDELMTFDLTPQPAPLDTAVLEITDPDQLKGWLEL
ncbi:M61 family metallopeptidase [Gallaecimonas pentaromativorans]|uniref:Putative metalloprotease with PDZ domain n=1 Tax=Gallaecimonas pentaromativorans TaxID=584787 RepID=A0A3N1PJG7_9GAMM|nr:PDZ domain-containing protein [Gallaecimonas pentaromativorans]ROQ27361.1 putative metalloprotease with PDZ domain [Gallaecimonas pentaromativorans]